MAKSKQQVTIPRSTRSAESSFTPRLGWWKMYAFSFAKARSKGIANPFQVVPTYQTEISPAPLRGFFVGSIQLFLTFGSLIAGIVNNSTAKYTNDAGWIIATSLQALPAVIILAGILFTPGNERRNQLGACNHSNRCLDSPRWLVSKDRSEDALKVLHKLRHRDDISKGLCTLELAAIQEEGSNVTTKEPWIALFKSQNRRRTGQVFSTSNIHTH